MKDFTLTTKDVDTIVSLIALEIVNLKQKLDQEYQKKGTINIWKAERINKLTDLHQLFRKDSD